MRVDWDKVEDEWKPWVAIVAESYKGRRLDQQSKLIEEFLRKCPESVAHAAAAALSVAKWHPAVRLDHSEKHLFCGHCFWSRHESALGACAGCSARVNSLYTPPCFHNREKKDRIGRRMEKIYLELLEQVPEKYLK